VRIIGATNADLPALAAAGKFRPDLLDRLAFDVILIPPLRERPLDIGLLARHFATRMTSELGRDYFPGFTDAALRRLEAAAWPGNVRELRNVVERSVYRMERIDRPLDRLFFDPFGGARRAAAGAGAVAGAVAGAQDAETGVEVERNFRARVRAFEAGLLRGALEGEKFNQRRAARALGLTYHQFRYHLRTHGLIGTVG